LSIFKQDEFFGIVCVQESHCFPKERLRAKKPIQNVSSKKSPILDNHNNTQNQSKSSVLYRLTKHITKASFGLFVCVLISSGLAPHKAKAGFFDTISSFVQNIAGADTEIVEEKNLQTAALLRPTGAQDQKSNYTTQVTGAASVSAGPLRISTEDEIYLPDVDTISVYVVKKTDTLNSIAKLFGVSVNTIVWANDLTNRKVIEGQVLTVLPVSGTRHTIKKGDTLKNIATKYAADIQELALFNGITDESELAIGETLIVPDGEVEEEKPKETTKPKDTKTVKKSFTKEVKKIIKNLAKEGYYMRPISGGSRTTGIHGNNAVDLAAAPGTSIVASAGGRVIISKLGGYNGGYGNYVVVSHSNGTQTLYAHNSDNLVSVGETVSQGQVIARVGSTGKSTGPHVHFEVRGARNPF
jgi:LysM repeat protein